MHTITLKHHILELKLISTTKHTSHSLISFCGHTFMSDGGFKGVLHLFYTSGVCLQVFGSTAAYVKEVVGYKTFPQLQRLSQCQLGLKTTSLKMKTICGCGVPKKSVISNNSRLHEA